MDWTSLAVGTSLIVMLAAPWITSTGVSWHFTENILFRFLLVLYVAMNIRLGALPGLLALLAVFSLYIERSHLLLSAFPNQKPNIPQPILTSVPLTALPFDSPKGTEVQYEPENEQSLSVPERHAYYEKAEFGDSNPRLAEGPQNSDEGTEFFEENGLV